MPESARCLVLASGSPRRLELLGQVVERFEVMVSGAEELIDTSLTPAENVLAIARAKADAVAQGAGSCLILAADTDVVLDGDILGKPRDAGDAAHMFRRLRGRSHEVYTAVVVLDPLTGESWDEVVRSEVRIRDLGDDEIEAYVATGEPLDKAGGYAIQGEAATMVEGIVGCYSNVVGLPICASVRLLELAGFRPRADAVCLSPYAGNAAHP
ncbi:MAG: Maf family protein [Thermomicrobiales bacterium]